LKINDSIAKGFVAYMKKYPNLYQNLAFTIFKEITNEPKKPIILDLGSGPGLLNNEIKKLMPNSIIFSLDASIKMLQNAGKCYYKSDHEQINGILSIAENIPLKSNSIDILVSRFSLSYWKKPRKAILEINRVLKPGGKLILEALNKNFPKWKLFLIKIHMMINFASKNIIQYHLEAYKSAYTIDQINKLLEDSDLETMRIEGSDKDWKYKIIAIKPNLKK